MPADQPPVAPPFGALTASKLIRMLPGWVADAHEVTRRLLDDLDDSRWMGPESQTVNPPLWEVGHIAWFFERWVLQHAAGEPPVLDRSEMLFDSMAIEHDIRWDLALPGPEAARAYADAVRDRVLAVLGRGDDPGVHYHALYAVFHQDMHTEAFAYSRQTLGWPAPCLAATQQHVPAQEPEQVATTDVEVAAGRYRVGAEADEAFVFDNEKWAHDVPVDAFAIARCSVTQREFAAFVDAGGYDDAQLWSREGWDWRSGVRANQPVYWRRENGSWMRRAFDRWVALEPNLPVAHVSWFEADAFCRWAGRRLPTEAEWEVAAAAGLGPAAKRQAFPWGDEAPDAGRANLDGTFGGPIDVRALALGDSAAGCRQMIGNVWEWTESPFEPYPGFRPDPYAEYSAPWFGDRRVLRGGSWATRGRMMRSTLRNFFPPDRRDIFSGFRTCRL